MIDKGKAGGRPALDTLIVGRSAPMSALRAMVSVVAPTNASVLLSGPSGCGKEVVARAVHLHSDRATKPFIAVNCGAIPRDLLESALFGHEKGAFTGAQDRHRGHFEEADGGTLFLDEIGDMPHDMQVKLLRVVEERVVQRVGGRGQIAVDVRIVAATHRDLDVAIEEGRFREDLYYRLAVFPIDLPSLAERPGDIPMLVQHFLAGLGKAGARVSYSSAAYGRLAEHGWPGNVRELRNFVERSNIMFAGRTIGADEVGALLLRRGRVSGIEQAALWAASERVAEPEIEPAEFQHSAVVVPIRPEFRNAEGHFSAAGSPLPLREILAEIERQCIEDALSMSEGVVADAARLLSLQRTTLIEKMRKYQMKAA